MALPEQAKGRVNATSKQRCGTVPRQHFPATQTDTRSVESASGFCTVNKEDAYEGKGGLYEPGVVSCRGHEAPDAEPLAE